MDDIAPNVDLSLDGFLRWEAEQPQRWERIRGVVRMMAGGTMRHATIIANVATLLRAHFRPRGCMVASSDVKVIAPTDDVMYPDVAVVCPRPPDKATFTREPTMVVEVLSERSVGDDDIRKRWAYEATPSLRCYLIVDQETATVDVSVRHPGTDWVRWPVRGREAVATVPGLGLELPLAEIFADVVLNGEEPGESPAS